MDNIGSDPDGSKCAEEIASTLGKSLRGPSGLITGYDEVVGNAMRLEAEGRIDLANSLINKHGIEIVLGAITDGK